MNMRNLIENDDAIGIVGSGVSGIVGSFIGSSCGALANMGGSLFMAFVTNIRTFFGNVIIDVCTGISNLVTM
jgi:uncharacterized membrane protein YeaQ/YmgE (transglycosylase-associated protein family)